MHAAVIAELLTTSATVEPSTCLDVACGTGHSTAPLLTAGRTVVGCDASPAMLRLARAHLPVTPFVCTGAERLPIRSGVVDLITVCMGFHWLDQPSFAREAHRVLRPAGELWVYNLWFPGELIGDPGFETWWNEHYLARFPAPPRRTASLRDVVRDHSIGFREPVLHELSHVVGFTRTSLRDYFMTQSNVEVAVRAGTTLDEVATWLDHELSDFFAGSESRDFRYVGLAEVATPE